MTNNSINNTGWTTNSAGITNTVSWPRGLTTTTGGTIGIATGGIVGGTGIGIAGGTIGTNTITIPANGNWYDNSISISANPIDYAPIDLIAGIKPGDELWKRGTCLTARGGAHFEGMIDGSTSAFYALGSRFIYLGVTCDFTLSIEKHVFMTDDGKIVRSGGLPGNLRWRKILKDTFEVNE